jgi:hypothetical protein
MNALLNSLTEAEFMLVRETEPARLAELDEDELLALHTRVRRARDKFTTSYRREASTKVTAYGGRGKAGPKNTRNAQKAEVFEDALARVSRRVAVAARHSAAELRSDRIEAARAERNTAPPRPSSRQRSSPQGSQRPQPVPASAPAARKRQASTKAAGARRQARRDSR